MADETPATRGSGPLERGEIPEVVALGKALTTLFKTLGVTQKTYANRIQRAESDVSRFLRGRKVAPQDFIDRLVTDVEAVRGTSLQPDVRSNLRTLRLGAIRVCDPSLYELESLRGEMEQTQREARALARHQEALHDLLEKKENEIRRLHAELDQVRQDWIADRLAARRAEVEVRAQAEAEADEDGLAEEIARLRADLAEITEARTAAERRCEELEAQVREMEEELAARSGEAGTVALPVEAVQEQLEAHWAAGRNRDAARELTEAALTRPVADLSDLIAWLDHSGHRPHGDHLVREVARVRAVEDVAAFGSRTLDRQWAPSSMRQAADRAGLLAAEACLVMTPQDIATLHLLWPGRWQPPRDRPRVLPPPDSVLEALLASPRGLDDLAEVMARIPADEKAAVTTLGSAATGFRGEYLLELLPLAVRFEWRELSSLLIAHFEEKADVFFVWRALGGGRLSDEHHVHWRSLTRILLDSVSLERFTPLFSGACKVYEDFLTVQGLGRTPLRFILQEIRDHGLMQDFSRIAGGRATLAPERRRERALMRKALTAWHAGQG
ncbi:hypothetical protein ACWCV9_28345 [Streptomyces sp. NPDC001606]